MTALWGLLWFVCFAVTASCFFYDGPGLTYFTLSVVSLAAWTIHSRIDDVEKSLRAMKEKP